MTLNLFCGIITAHLRGGCMINIKKVNDSFKIAFFESDGKIVSTVVDKYGNILSPFFDDVSVVPYSKSNCVVLGKEGKNKKNTIYSLYCSDTDPCKSCCKKVKFPYEVTYARVVDHDTMLFLSSQGLCFVDNKTFEQKSDFYDALHYNKDSKVNSWVYEKEVEGDSINTILTGLISPDGTVSDYAYDTFFHKHRKVETSKVSRFCYDVIETKEVTEELNQRVKDNNSKIFNGLRKILTMSNK